jgi:hypothetical protein
VKIAVIGGGVSGLTCAWLLRRDHQVVLYEAERRPGGHANTVDVEVGGELFAVDTGFIVFNPRNYPLFTRLLGQLGVEKQPAEMSFSVSRDDGFEYGTSSLPALLARPSSLLRPEFWRMGLDIPRFYRDARQFLSEPDPKLGLEEWLADRGYSRAFVDLHLLPMCAAIWSTDRSRIGEHPAQTLLGFLENHGLLQLSERPQWYSIVGGSRSYVSAMARGLGASLQLGRAVRRIQRERDHVQVLDASGQLERFHHVVIAAHSDQALALLADPSAAERQVLGSIRYQTNDAVLHCDPGLLPHSRRAWSSWNFRLRAAEPERVRVTYWMNRLQRLRCPLELCVTLNDSAAIQPARILHRFSYAHPILDRAAVSAQSERAAIDGVRRTHYCGAWWGHGFHEDGVRSALHVTRRFGLELA